MWERRRPFGILDPSDRGRTYTESFRNWLVEELSSYRNCARCRCRRIALASVVVAVETAVADIAAAALGEVGRSKILG